MTTNNWREEYITLITKLNGPFDESLDSDDIQELENFIETQIALARKEGAEEMKKKCLEVIQGKLDSQFLEDCNPRGTLNEIRNSISSL